MSKFYISLSAGLFRPQIIEVYEDGTVAFFNDRGQVDHADTKGAGNMLLVEVPEDLIATMRSMAYHGAY